MIRGPRFSLSPTFPTGCKLALNLFFAAWANPGVRRFGLGSEPPVEYLFRSEIVFIIQNPKLGITFREWNLTCRHREKLIAGDTWDKRLFKKVLEQPDLCILPNVESEKLLHDPL
jgi:hypothetical protein